MNKTRNTTARSPVFRADRIEGRDVRQILGTSRRSFVSNQVVSRKHADGSPLDIDLKGIRERFLEVQARDSHDNIDPPWSHADLENGILPEQILPLQIDPRCAKSINGPLDSLGVFRGGIGPKINIERRPRNPMGGHGVGSDEQKLTLLGG